MKAKRFNKNAKDLLSEIMKERKWHQNKYSISKAAGFKLNLAKGKLSYEKCCEILTDLGYHKVTEEIWEVRKPKNKSSHLQKK